MKIIKGNIWDYWFRYYTITIPTNGTIKKDDSCVMGKGLALQAKNYVYNIEYLIGNRIKESGNKVYYIKNNIISFPVKNNWWEKADIKLIENSCIALLALIDTEQLFGNILEPIYLPKVGCGNGKLNWKEVEPILDKYLDERFIIVDLN